MVCTHLRVREAIPPVGIMPLFVMPAGGIIIYMRNKSRHQAIHGYDPETGEYVFYGHPFDPVDEVSGKRVPNGRGIYRHGKYIDPRDRGSYDDADEAEVWQAINVVAFDPSLGRQAKPAGFHDD